MGGRQDRRGHRRRMGSAVGDIRSAGEQVGKMIVVKHAFPEDFVLMV